MAGRGMDIENFDGGLIEEGEEPIRDSLLGDVYDGMSRELVVHYVDGVEARRPGLGIGREANRIACNAKRWSMVATGISGRARRSGTCLRSPVRLAEELEL